MMIQTTPISSDSFNCLTTYTDFSGKPTVRQTTSRNAFPVYETSSHGVQLPEGFSDFDDFYGTFVAEYGLKEEVAKAAKELATTLYGEDEHSITKYRLLKGLTQEEFAQQLGVSQPYVSKLESGPVDAKISTIRKLVEVLGQPVMDVISALETGPRGE